MICIFVVNENSYDMKSTHDKSQQWSKNRVLLKTTFDLKLLPDQVIYVEGSYNRKANSFIKEKQQSIQYRVRKELGDSADFIYLPTITDVLSKAETHFSFFLHYYFPKHASEADLHAVLTTKIETTFITHAIFSVFNYDEPIRPGLLRYIQQNSDGNYEYEYFQFDLSWRSDLSDQINHYASRITRNYLWKPTEVVKRERAEESSVKSAKDKDTKSKKVFHSRPFFDFGDKFKDLFDDEELRELKEEPKPELQEQSRARFQAEELDIERVEAPKPVTKEQELIDRIIKDIENMKELGFYDLLMKEIGSLLFQNEEQETLFEPSRLVIDNDFRIFLPDFNNMEITMTPLPKTLFILFLRHPDGIFLKDMSDYRRELLELYKLISYREDFFEMTESINRICNPGEGSINEKLSRIKEAFLRQMSMDTAKYYIVNGDRGQEKKIMLDRLLVELPQVFSEIETTIADYY